MTTPIIFTPELMGEGEQPFKLSAPLMRRLATIPGPDGRAVRAQLERAAAVVPDAQRSRVLGPLRSLRASDDQARAAIGVLLLAKTLEDLGWVVAHEPEVDGGTPDLRIFRGGQTYLVEVIRVTRAAPAGDERTLFQVRDALRAVRTTTPLHLHSVRVPGSASLKTFVGHIQEVLSKPPPKGQQVFEERGVRIAYEVLPPLGEGIEVGAVASLPIRMLHGGGHELVRAALNTKLGTYKVPLIVALDLFDLTLPFETVEDVLFGERTITFDFDPEEGVTGEGRTGRSDSGLLMKPGHRGDRARERLVAVLPFRLSGQGPDGSWKLHPRLLANPAREPNHDFAEFAPIPRMVVVCESEQGRHLEYRFTADSSTALNDEDDNLLRWSHVP